MAAAAGSIQGGKMGRLIAVDEVWKPIKNFENYQISSYGNVKNSKGIILKQWHKGKYGHAMIGLSKNNKSYKFQIHRLVAEHFIDNPQNKPEVCHIDNSLDSNGFLNNSVNNLKWGTHKENCEFENTRKRQSENHADFKGEKNPNYGKRKTQEEKDKISKSKGIPIIQTTDDFIIINEFNSIKEAGRKTGICWVSINNVCKKQYIHAGGYRWFYKKDFIEIVKAGGTNV